MANNGLVRRPPNSRPRTAPKTLSVIRKNEMKLPSKLFISVIWLCIGISCVIYTVKTYRYEYDLSRPYGFRKENLYSLLQIISYGITAIVASIGIYKRKQWSMNVIMGLSIITFLFCAKSFGTFISFDSIFAVNVLLIILAVISVAALWRNDTSSQPLTSKLMKQEMLKEYPVRQHQGELKRRCFSDDFFDIYVWVDNHSTISKFQLCYNKKRNEHALTWTKENGFQHYSIDDGEASPTKNQTPIFASDGLFPANEVFEKFVVNSEGIDQKVRSFLIEKLSSYECPTRPVER